MHRSHFFGGVQFFIGVCFTLLAVWCSADVKIIFDNGNTRSLAPFLESIKNKPIKKSTQTSSSSAKGSPKSGAAEVNNLLPIQSEGLTLGDVKNKAIKRPFSRPFFLIGSDHRSRQWLTLHRDVLKAINAVGMLVQAESVDDLRAIADIAQGLPIIPASATDITDALDIHHYPVLVTPRGVEQ